MAYNKTNKLLQVFIVQEFYKIQTAKGIPNVRIWKTITMIYPMSIKTFYNYMGINAKKQLKELSIVKITNNTFFILVFY